MVLKLIGACFVIISFGMIGTLIGKNMAKRPEELRQIQFGLQALETEIMYSATPLPQALKIVAKQTRGAVARVFDTAASELASGEGQTAGEAWTKALKKTRSYLLLTDRELMILEQFGQGLGLSDREDQSKRLTSAKLQLAAREKEAEIERNQYQKLSYRTGHRRYNFTHFSETSGKG